MYQGFNLDIEGNDFSDFYEIGKKIHKMNKKSVKKDIESLKGDDGILMAEKITAKWFSEIEADVFLSHSHKNKEEVVGLSGWLSENFGVHAFIDSCVWGRSDHLLKLIDDAYCLNNSRGTYNYKKRNRSTSHVYMMLSVALTKMINRCDCIIFVNTPQSISVKNSIGAKGDITYSPWIYHEIMTTGLIKKQRKSDRFRTIDEARVKNDSMDLSVQYDVDLSHLTDVTFSDLQDIAHKHKDIEKSKLGRVSLSDLYGIRGK